MTTATQRRSRSDGERSRTTILRAAADLATIDGLDGLSIGNLAAHIGMSKSGLYAHFGSKEELQLATVETAKEIFEADVIEPASAVADPLGRVEALCERFLSHVGRGVFPGGCFFASTGAEFDTHPGRVRDEIASVQQGWIQLIAHLVGEAQAAGAARADEDPVQVAFELDAYLIMGNTGFVMHRDPAYLERARTAVRRRIEQASR